MPNYNRVILMGNITRDIELRHTPNTNTAIAQIGLAVNRKWRDTNTNEMKEEVTFVDCEAWGSTAENIAKFFGKGKPIFIEGRLRLDTWKDKTDGSNRSKVKVVVEEFRFVDSRPGGGGPPGDGEGAPAVQTRTQRAAAPAGAAEPAETEGPAQMEEGDIPV